MEKSVILHPFMYLEWLAHKLHIDVGGPHVLYGLFVSIFLVVAAFFATRALKEVPTGLQNFMEVIIEGIEGLILETMGPKGVAYLPMLATFALFILVSNLIALIPGFYPPTANLNTNLALAGIVFVMTHVIGFKEHGFAYIKHFMGPIWWLAPLMIIIELIGHLARPISLTLRLFGNMYGHEVVLAVFLFLAPLIVPSVMMGMGVLIALIQTFVFTLLAMIYIAGALEEAH